jgi:hypothetical protein
MRIVLLLAAISCFGQAVDSREYRVGNRVGRLESEIPFLAVGANWKATSADAQIMVRASKDGVRWSRWIRIEAAGDTCSELLRSSSRLVFFDWDTRMVEYQIGAGLDDFRFVLIDPGRTPERQLQRFRSARVQAPPVSIGKPAYISRIEWGSPDGDQARGPLSYMTVTHLIVHHSADNFTGTDYAAWMRAIWRYHVFNNGWVDFGYNWAIDPDGNLYEGRAGGDNVVGAHFSCQNSGTMGVVMLGTFTNAVPTPAAMSTLSRLLAWKADQRSIDPLGRSTHRGLNSVLDNISGHRDGNRLPGSCTVTECPGDALYRLLPEVRHTVADRIANASKVLLTESFEGPLLPREWKADGMWRWWDGMAWFGMPETKTYEPGGAGTLESPEFVVSADAMLYFRSWHDTEQGRASFDRKWVEISVDGGDWQVVDELVEPYKEWTERSYKLAVRGKVRLRFRFDSVDDVENAYEGWYLDDIRVEVAQP